jgi:hypothetical protein
VGGPQGIGPSLTRFLDTDADNNVSPIDAVLVINWLNSNPVGASPDGEGEDMAAASLQAAAAPIDDFFFDLGSGAGAAGTVNSAASSASEADLASIIAAMADDAAQQNKRRRTPF